MGAEIGTSATAIRKSKIAYCSAGLESCAVEEDRLAVGKDNKDWSQKKKKKKFVVTATAENKTKHK